MSLKILNEIRVNNERWSEDRSWKLEDRSRKSEVRSWKLEVRLRTSIKLQSFNL